MTARRPIDIPDLVRDLRGYIERAPLDYLRQLWGEGDLVELSEEGRVGLARAVRSGLNLSESFYVVDDMARLVEASAQQLDRVSVAAHDFVSPAGFLYMPGGWRFDETQSRRPGALQWTVIGNRVMLVTWDEPESITERAVDRLGGTPHLAPTWCVTTVLSENESLTYQPRHSAHILSTVMAACYLLRQKLVVIRQPAISRSERRQAERRHVDLNKIRVIALRTREVITDDPGGGRDYQHRWVVRGHWRQQWYDVDQVHRPIWISPHVKGPDGAPLLGTDKVYSLQR